jgi:5-formyltetrahydrofolate cyclo-ligase
MLPSIPRNKQQLRQQCRQQRDALASDLRRQASLMICRHIREWEVFHGAEIIQAYMPMRSEVDLASLLEGFPHKHWVIPRILPEGRMVFQRYDPARLVRHPFGMLEPAPDLPIIAPKSIELALVPGLAFDRHGWRLGYGGGFFDRFLGQFKGVSLGITFEALWLNILPHDTYDIPMNFVVTEMGLTNVGQN